MRPQFCKNPRKPLLTMAAEYHNHPPWVRSPSSWRCATARTAPTLLLFHIGASLPHIVLNGEPNCNVPYPNRPTRRPWHYTSTSCEHNVLESNASSRCDSSSTSSSAPQRLHACHTSGHVLSHVSTQLVVLHSQTFSTPTLMRRNKLLVLLQLIPRMGHDAVHCILYHSCATPLRSSYRSLL